MLVIGTDNWIGKYIYDYLNKDVSSYNSEIKINDFIKNEKNINNLNLIKQKLKSSIIEYHNIGQNDKNVICCIYKSFGKNIYSVNEIESNLYENILYNLELPLLVAQICKDLNIHCTMISNGCLYQSNNKNDKLINEESIPDLTVSNHSIVSITKENIINLVNDNCLNLRLRYPISCDFNPECYLSKLITFSGVLNCNNSVSILEDLLPIAIELIKNKEIGVYNLCNDGYINSVDTLLKYKYTIDENIEINEISEDKHDITIGKRSNLIVSNQKLNNKITEINYKNNTNLSLPDATISINEKIINMKNKCKQLKSCLCCSLNNTLNTVLNLGYQPLANDFHKDDYFCNYYPLHLKYCKNCYHCQLSHAVNPDILFKNYKYVSGTSKTGLDFFNENANMINNLFTDNNKKNKLKILDIASNDGSQLNYFKDLNWDTYGIDPATNLCPVAEKQGHNIVCDYFNEDTATKYYKNNNIIFDVITAQNVFAHTEFIDSFLQGCKLIMSENSSLFIQTSQRDMILNGEFDTTYHEHISFYSTKSMRTLVEKNGLSLHKVYEHSIHGRSYIFEIKLNNINQLELLPEEIEEEKIGIYNPIMYEKFNLNAKRSIENLNVKIKHYLNLDYKIIGFGAAAKGQTLLCYSNIDLEYIIDENPLKINNLSPKLNIPIKSLEDFKNEYISSDNNNNNSTKYLILILAWNFAKEIKEKIKKIIGDKNQNVLFIEKYFPELILSNN